MYSSQYPCGSGTTLLNLTLSALMPVLIKDGDPTENTPTTLCLEIATIVSILLDFSKLITHASPTATGIRFPILRDLSIFTASVRGAGLLVVFRFAI